MQMLPLDFPFPEGAGSESFSTKVRSSRFDVGRWTLDVRGSRFEVFALSRHKPLPASTLQRFNELPLRSPPERDQRWVIPPQLRGSSFDVRCSMFDVESSAPLPGWVTGGLSRVSASTLQPLQRSNTPTLPRSPCSAIQWTPHAQSRLLHHVRVKLRGAHVFVPE